MEKQIINTNQAPTPIGPYSQAVKVGNLLFVSGQIPYDETTDTLILEDIQKATHQVFKNISAILTEAGADFGHIVKSSIFLMDMNNFTKVNEVYGTYFNNHFPARECVQVAGLPRGVHIEISVIASL